MCIISHMMLKKYASKLATLHEIWSSHSSEYDEYCWLGCAATYSGRNLSLFLKNLLPHSSWQKVREARSQEMLVSVKERGITSYTPVFFIQEQINKRRYMMWDD